MSGAEALRCIWDMLGVGEKRRREELSRQYDRELPERFRALLMRVAGLGSDPVALDELTEAERQALRRSARTLESLAARAGVLLDRVAIWDCGEGGGQGAEGVSNAAD